MRIGGVLPQQTLRATSVACTAYRIHLWEMTDLRYLCLNFFEDLIFGTHTGVLELITFEWRVRIPGWPELSCDKRTPAYYVACHDGQRQFDSFRLGLGQALHGRQFAVSHRRRGRTTPNINGVALQLEGGQGRRSRAWPLTAWRRLADYDGCGRADAGGGWQCRKRRRRCGTPPYDRTDSDVDGRKQQQRDDVDGASKPADVQRKRPLRIKVLPAVVDARSSRRQLDEVEDDELRNGEDGGGDPRDGDQTVGAGGRPRMTAHWVADSDVAIEGGRHEHIRWRVENEYLAILD